MIRYDTQQGINQLLLRFVAFFLMCLCSLGTVLEINAWAGFGWISFPIFAFLLTEGFHYTIDKRKYALRLIVFAAISEPLFDLLLFHDAFDPAKQNPIFTLCIGFLAIWVLDYIRDKFNNYFVTLLAIAVLIFLGRLVCDILAMQFAEFGVAFVILFYIADKVTYPKLLEIACVAYICFHLSRNIFSTVTIFGIQYEIAIEIFAFLSLIVIWAYNGERGPNTIFCKIAYYLAYPVHLLIFYVISLFI